MTTAHCNKFLLHNVFKTLFTIKPNITITAGKRRLTTGPQKVYDYNKLLRTHAETFKKKESSQREAEKLLEEMKSKRLEATSQTWLHLVLGVSAQRHRTHVQNQRLEDWLMNLLILEKDKERIASKLDKFKMVLRGLSSYGHPKLYQMFLKMNDMVELPVDSWHMAMKGCIKARKIEDALRLFELLREKEMATMTSYEILIESYLYLKQQTNASRMFSIMLQDNVAANYHTYELFIQYYMKLDYLPEHAEKLYKLWQAVLMTTNNEVPDKMIQDYLLYFGKNGELSRVEQVYLDIKSRQLNRICVGRLNKTIIRFSKRKQLRSALSLYYDLIGQGYKPSKNVIEKITQACISRDDKEAVQQLIDITKEHFTHE